MKAVKIFLFIATFWLLVGCGGNDPGNLQVESVKGGKLIADVPANLIKAELLKKGLIDNNNSVFGFKAYKIIYNTTDDNNKTVKASGVMIVPSKYNTTAEDAQKLLYMQSIGMPMVVNCHGTIFSNKEAPSVVIESSAATDDIGVLYSSIYGFITLEPDYIGFGESKEHYQPYLLKKSSANAVVDFVKAAIEFAQKNSIPILDTKDIYITGYSQGGAVALSALKVMQEDNLNVKIAVPMAGPYLLDPIAQHVLSEDNISVPSFMAAAAYSYSKAYNHNVNELIQEPFASKLPTLFNGSLSRVQIDKELTNKVKGDGGLFTNNIVQNYSGSWFQQKLQENSVVDFTPTVMVKMLHCIHSYGLPFNGKQKIIISFNTLHKNSR